MAYMVDFEDVLDRKGYVSRAKLSNCAFARLKPGEYVCFSFFREDLDGLASYGGCVFAKVISVRMPKPEGLIIGKQDPGGVLVELPDGSRVEVLKYWHSYSRASGSTGGYNPSDQLRQYFMETCLSDAPFRLHHMDVYVYSTDMRSELKDAMMKEQERRKIWQEQLKQQEAQHRAAAQAARQRAAEEARRNASITDRELDDLFRGR